MQLFPAVCFADGDWLPHTRGDGRAARKRRLPSGRWIYDDLPGTRSFPSEQPFQDSQDDPYRHLRSIGDGDEPVSPTITRSLTNLANAPRPERHRVLTELGLNADMVMLHRDFPGNVPVLLANRGQRIQDLKSLHETYQTGGGDSSQRLSDLLMSMQDYDAATARQIATRAGIDIPDDAHSYEAITGAVIHAVAVAAVAREAISRQRELDALPKPKVTGAGTASELSIAGKATDPPVIPSQVQISWAQDTDVVAKDLFGRDVDDGVLAALANAPSGSKVTILKDKLTGGLQILTMADGLQSKRVVYRDGNGKLILNNKIFTISRASPYHGKGAALFLNQTRAAHSLGIQRVSLFAAGNLADANSKNPWNGYYTWPRFGFDGKIYDHDFEKLPGPMKKRMGKSRQIQDLFAIPGGMEAWELHGDGLALGFDMDEKHFSRLEDYLSKRQLGEIGGKPVKPPSASMEPGDARLEARERELQAIIDAKMSTWAKQEETAQPSKKNSFLSSIFPWW